MVPRGTGRAVAVVLALLAAAPALIAALHQPFFIDLLNTYEGGSLINNAARQNPEGKGPVLIQGVTKEAFRAFLRVLYPV